MDVFPNAKSSQEFYSAARSARALQPELEEDPALETVCAEPLPPEDWDCREPDESQSRIEKSEAQIKEQVLAHYREIRPRLFRYLRSLEVGRDQADEIIQETFLRLTTQLLAKREIKTLEGWVIRVAHNLAINAQERMNREEHLLSSGWDVLSERVDPSANPEQLYLEKEQRQRMKEALKQLSEKQRACFLMRTQGFRYQEIAVALGITIGRANVLVQRAAERLAALCD